jgi:hypothetical protein
MPRLAVGPCDIHPGCDDMLREAAACLMLATARTVEASLTILTPLLRVVTSVGGGSSGMTAGLCAASR